MKTSNEKINYLLKTQQHNCILQNILPLCFLTYFWILCRFSSLVLGILLSYSSPIPALIKTTLIIALGHTTDSTVFGHGLRKAWRSEYPYINTSKIGNNLVLEGIRSKSWWLGVLQYPTDFTFTWSPHARIGWSSGSPWDASSST